jgi:hypothetical protein
LGEGAGERTARGRRGFGRGSRRAQGGGAGHGRRQQSTRSSRERVFGLSLLAGGLSGLQTHEERRRELRAAAGWPNMNSAEFRAGGGLEQPTKPTMSLEHMQTHGGHGRAADSWWSVCSKQIVLVVMGLRAEGKL